MRRKLKIGNNLIKLAEILKDEGDLYIVGGYVRNSVMGINTEDIDLASRISAERVIELCSANGYKAVPINLRLGTLKIIKGNDSYEYTAFRTDSYPQSSGAHKPAYVQFTDDIYLDASRRDFTINAIYYNILEQDFCDFFNGIQDITNKIIRTTLSPEKVFSEDGLRILRMVRFAAELGFDIEESTFFAATDRVQLLEDIAKERIQVELNKILYSDSKYNILDACSRGLILLEGCGILNTILPNIKWNNLLDIQAVPNKFRLAALLIAGYNSFNDIEHALNLLKLPNREMKRVLSLKRMYDMISDSREEAVKMIVEDRENVEGHIILLKLFSREEESKLIIEELDRIERDNLPVNVRQLKVKGEDLIRFNIDKSRRSSIMRELLIMSALNGYGTYDEQLKHLREELWKN